MKKTDSLNADDGFQFKLSLFYIAIFLSIGCYMPYFPLWLTWRGMGPQEVSIILASPMVVRIFLAPLISIWADLEGNYRKILIILSSGSLVALVCFSWVEGFHFLLLIAGFNAIFWSAIIPLTETMAMNGQRAKKLHYGRARSWGSASFIVGSVVVGLLVDVTGAWIVLLFLIAAGLFILSSALMLPRPVGAGRLREAVSEGRFSGGDVVWLVKQWVFWVFLLAAGLGQASHAFYYGFATLHWQGLGMAGWLIGVLWALAVIAEIMLFVFIGDWLRKFNPVVLIIVGLLVAILRWGLAGLDATLWVLIPGQLMHACSFGLLHLGAMYFISQAIPPRLSATAQGLNATMTAGVLMGALILASGALYKSIGAHGYFVMAGVASFGLLLAVYLLHSWNGKVLSGEP